MTLPPESMLPFMLTLILLAIVVSFFIVLFLITFQKQAGRKHRAYLEALIKEKDETMSRVSAEVHDHINQMLNVLRMNLHMLGTAEETQRKNAVKQMGALLDQIILDSNNISHTLNADYLKKKGLVRSLKEEKIWVNASGKMHCTLDIQGIRGQMEPQTELMIFRIAQEAINNSIKHSEATELDISLRYEQSGFLMRIRDNGIGFPASENGCQTNLGMENMRERARILNGKLEVKSEPGKGAEVRLEITDL